MFCQNCGGKISDGSAFCPNCGARAEGNNQTAGQASPEQPAGQKGASMLLLNIDHIPDKKVRALGLVKGNSAQSRNAGKDLMAGFKNMVGGEIAGYTEMTSTARQIALTRMQEEARGLGADAVINIRYDSASLAVQGIAEVMVDGTGMKSVEE